MRHPNGNIFASMSLSMRSWCSTRATPAGVVRPAPARLRQAVDSCAALQDAAVRRRRSSVLCRTKAERLLRPVPRCVSRLQWPRQGSRSAKFSEQPQTVGSHASVTPFQAQRHTLWPLITPRLPDANRRTACHCTGDRTGVPAPSSVRYKSASVSSASASRRTTLLDCAHASNLLTSLD